MPSTSRRSFLPLLLFSPLVKFFPLGVRAGAELPKTQCLAPRAEPYSYTISYVTNGGESLPTPLPPPSPAIVARNIYRIDKCGNYHLIETIDCSGHTVTLTEDWD
jgi:hypothetical protein